MLPRPIVKDRDPYVDVDQSVPDKFRELEDDEEQANSLGETETQVELAHVNSVTTMGQHQA
jgi:hypothetical protein